MKILIADDDAVTRLLLTATLKKLGHEVVAAKNGREAWTAWSCAGWSGPRTAPATPTSSC